VSSDYPLANEANLNEDAEDLAKLTEHSLVHKKNSNHTKPRPVVVKLDEGEEIRVGVKKPKPKDDLLSGAVREILLSNEDLSTSSHGIPSDKPSSKSKGKEKLNMDLSVQSKENMADAEKPDHGNSTSRRSKHRSRHRSPKKKDNAEKGEENGKKEKQKSSHRHGRHRTRQKVNESLKVATQSAVIPDFLL
jgi:AP-3 complex subunit delta-1